MKMNWHSLRVSVITLLVLHVNAYPDESSFGAKSLARVPETTVTKESIFDGIISSFDSFMSGLHVGTTQFADYASKNLMFTLDWYVPYFEHVMTKVYGKDYRLNSSFVYYNQMFMTKTQKIDHEHLMKRFYEDYDGNYDLYLENGETPYNPNYEKFEASPNIKKSQVLKILDKNFHHAQIDKAFDILKGALGFILDLPKKLGDIEVASLFENKSEDYSQDDDQEWYTTSIELPFVSFIQGLVNDDENKTEIKNEDKNLSGDKKKTVDTEKISEKETYSDLHSSSGFVLKDPNAKKVHYPDPYNISTVGHGGFYSAKTYSSNKPSKLGHYPSPTLVSAENEDTYSAPVYKHISLSNQEEEHLSDHSSGSYSDEDSSGVISEPFTGFSDVDDPEEFLEFLVSKRRGSFDDPPHTTARNRRSVNDFDDCEMQFFQLLACGFDHVIVSYIIEPFL